jgi:hypothetical protein
MVNEDHYVRHNRHSYIRQKVWEALRCLVSTKLFRDRLAAAAGPLLDLRNLHRHLLDELPDDVRSKFDDVTQVLTKHPPEWKGDSVAAASVRSLTPRQRTKIAEDILDIYVAVSGGL